MKDASLPELLEDASLVICLGPGGVGKTTISAVLALHRAAAGRRSLVLTIDPARRLADALSLSGLTNDPVEVPSFGKMHPAGTLNALMLDPTATADQMIGELVPDLDRRESMLHNPFYRHMSRNLTGTLEYMAVERLYALSRSDDYDAIVLDTPPTTNALDFVDAPNRIAAFMSDKVTRWFKPAKDRSWSAKLFNRAGASVLSLMTRFAGSSFAEETVDFFAVFGDILRHFRERALAIQQLLRDPRVVFLVICSPDPNRIAEAKAIDANLVKAGCKARGFIINGVDQAFLPQAEALQQALGRATALLGGAGERERVELFIERLRALRDEHESVAATHRSVVETMQRYAGERPVFSAPRVPAGESPRAALLALYIGLFVETADPVSPQPEQPAPEAWPTELERRARKLPDA